MLDTSARLLRLLSLLRTRRSWTGLELSERLGITARTLRRDIDRLRELDYPVASVSGPGGGYTFGDGSELPPLLLGEDEAVTVAVALRTAVESGEGHAERVLGVLTKLEQLMPERLRSRVGALQSQTLAVGWAGHRVDASLLSTLAAACLASEAVRLRYRTHEGETSERQLYPLRLAHTGSRRWYLVAWDVARDGWRTFRVDRIEGIASVGPRVVRPEPPADLARYVSDAITTAPYPCRARVVLRGTPESLAANVPSWIGHLVPLDAERCLLELGAPTWETVVSQLVITGVDFELLDPPELREHLRQIVDRLVGAATERRSAGSDPPPPLRS